MNFNTRTATFSGHVVTCTASLGVSLSKMTVTADASDLGLRAGQEPQAVTLESDGEHLDFTHSETVYDEDEAVKKWVLTGPNFTMTVFND
jgi:hypothetical protein